MDTLTTYHQFRQHTANDVSAALLTLAAALTGAKADDTPLTVKQAAECLAVSPDTIYTLCAAGKLRHQRVGKGRGTIRIAPDDLQPKIFKLRELM